MSAGLVHPARVAPENENTMRRIVFTALMILLAVPASAGPGIVAASGPMTRITVLTPDDLAPSIHEEGGVLIFRAPNGDVWELIPSPSDPEISNPGDGSFHPYPAEETVAAVRAIESEFTAGVEATICILPLPRRGLLDSSAAEGIIYLSPSVRPMAVSQIHAVVAHEMGHVVHRAFLPDTDVEGWNRYRTVRGITDPAVYSESAAHRNRPHEIFAEDFRYLFGGPLANTAGTIENSSLALPDDVPDLRETMVSFVSAPAPAAALLVSSYPNPFADRTTVVVEAPSSAAPSSYSLRIFDVSGRLVRTLEEGSLGTTPALLSVSWDGRDERGQAAAIGVYFAVIEAGALRSSSAVLILR
jgi:hypothetical protein